MKFNLIYKTKLWVIVSALTCLPSMAFSEGQSLDICNGQFAELPTADTPSKGCVVNTQQVFTDPATQQAYNTDVAERRYIVYAPKKLPKHKSVPLLFVYHGHGVNAEAVALYDTRNRFEELADKKKFIVVYPNALGEVPGLPAQNPNPGFGEVGYFQGCNLPHDGENVDIKFSRQIVDELTTAGLNVDSKRIYATGISGGGGMAFTIAMEAPDFVSAIAPVVPVPFHFEGIWQGHCNVHPDSGSVSITMAAGTADPILPYEFTDLPDFGFYYPGMENTRDSWLEKMGIHGEPLEFPLWDLVDNDSYEPHSGMANSSVILSRYPKGPQGQVFQYYKIVGGGHVWPHHEQTSSVNWPALGKNNQDIDFALHAWLFFKFNPRRL